MTLNNASLKLILDYEVGGGQSYYERNLRYPVWPNGESGVTIGVGYDLGYNTRASVVMAWDPRIGEEKTDRLIPCIGIKGEAAHALLPSVRDVEIPWSAALSVFLDTDVPTEWRSACRTYPGIETLHPNAQGAILSLGFNRGWSLNGPRRTEMKEIKALVAAQDYAGIADQILAMKRIWIGTSIEGGMSARRNAEAALVESVI